MDKKFTDNDWNDLFQEFWIVYPPRNGIKNGKSPAKKSWNKIKEKSLETFNTIIKAVQYMKTTKQWTEDSSKIPMASTFLNQQRWEIEFTDDMEKAIADSFEPKETKDVEPTKTQKDKVDSEKTSKAEENEKPKKGQSIDVVVLDEFGTVPEGSLRQQYLRKIGYGG